MYYLGHLSHNFNFCQIKRKNVDFSVASVHPLSTQHNYIILLIKHDLQDVMIDDYCATQDENSM